MKDLSHSEFGFGPDVRGEAAPEYARPSIHTMVEDMNHLHGVSATRSAVLKTHCDCSFAIVSL